MAGGRPTDYSEEMLEKAKQYLQERQDEVNEFHKTRGEKSDSYERLVKVNLPTVEGLAIYLGVSRPTVYLWAKTHPEFSYIFEEILAEQSDRLIKGSLSGDYNPVIAKLLLAKHGYIERQDVTTDGKALPSPILPPSA